jgi:transcriptional regulator GlxA family with amidase domain
LADHLRVSARTLERRFKGVLGRTPAKEILRQRIERAKQLLAETDMPLADIAARCGYNYLSNLSHAIRADTGMTPTAWRKRVQRGG